MLKKHFWKATVVFILAIAMILPNFTFVARSTEASAPLSVATATGVMTAAETETSVFDKVLSLVSEKGADIVKSNLPTVGDFLCSKVFGYLGIDYADSYTKEARKVNEKLSLIQDDLQELLKTQTKQVSQNTMLSFYNNVDVLADRIYPIYTGYCSLTDKENSGEYTPEQASQKETEFYESNLKNLIFGSASSTGNLYLQLKNFSDTICMPNVTVQHQSLMDDYRISYEHRWAFESQSFTPKKEFLGYASSTLIEGLTLYAFQNAYEKAHANEEQKIVLEAEWARLQASAGKALGYLQSEIKKVTDKEKAASDAGTIYHYASGLTLSKEMYISKVSPVQQGNHLTYLVCTSKKRTLFSPVINTLNQRSLMNQIQNDFQNYKKFYNKGSDFKISDFLQVAGFQSDNWNAYLYRGQSYHGEVPFVGDNLFKFYLEYTDHDGNAQSSEWARGIQYSGFKFKDDTFNLKDSSGWSVMAFVKPDGYLAGSYEETYNHRKGKTGAGSYVPKLITKKLGRYDPSGNERGKVK